MDIIFGAALPCFVLVHLKLRGPFSIDTMENVSDL